MNIDAKALTTFIAVADAKSFSRAAAKLYLTQPALSKRIAELERQLGARLFQRHGRAISLTEPGQQLLPKARLAVLAIEDAVRTVRDEVDGVRGTLALATNHHLGLWRLPPILRRFNTLFPEAKLELHFMDSEVAYHATTDGELELAVLTLPDYVDPRLESRVIWHDPLVFVAAAGHALAAGEGLTLADLAHHPAVLPDLATYTGRLISRHFEERQLALHVASTTNYLETVRMLIGIGLGWGMLPRTMIDDRLVPLNVDHPPLERRLGYVHRARRHLSSAAAALVGLLEEEREGL